MTKTAYFTICSANYLATAKVLLDSLRKNTNMDIYLIICDGKRDNIPKFLNDPTKKIIFADELNIKNFNDFIFRYSILEINTALKPFVFNELFKKKYKKVFYFDPDIIIEDSLDHFESILDSFNAIVTPHILSPFRDNRKPSLEDISKSGVYNLGFLGLTASSTKTFLDWWMQKCRSNCYSDVERGLFTDQKFCDFLTSFVKNTKIYTGPEANIAYWNLHERDIVFKNNTYYSNQTRVLFFHFSGLDYDKNFNFVRLSKHENRFTNKINEDLLNKVNSYLKQIKENEYMLEEIGIDKEYKFNKINGIELFSFSRSYIKEAEIQTGELDFTNIDNEWFYEPSVELPEFTKVPRIFLGIYLERTDLKKTFNIKTSLGLEAFYRWVSNQIYLKELPENLSKYVPSDNSHKFFDKDIIRQKTYNFLEIVAKKYPNLSSNKLLRKFKIIAKRLLYKPSDVSFKNGENVFGLFPKYKDKLTLKKGINVFGYFDASTGVANGAKLMNRMLHNIGVKTSIYSVNIDDNSQIKKKLPGSESWDISLFHINADQTANCIPYIDNKLKTSFKIGYWAWELERFPSESLKNGKFLNDLWVPSSFVANSIERSCSFSPKIIPHPVTKHLSGDFGIKDKFNLNDCFNVVFTFDLNSYSSRKNPMGAINAYVLACANKEFKSNSSLIIKMSGHFNKMETLAKFDELREKNKINAVIIDEVLTENEMHGLRNITNVFLSLHRSEGFGLNLIENMNAGNLVIATNYSGNKDFMNESNSLLVDFKLTPVKESEYPDGNGQFWAEPSIHDAAEKLLWSYQNSSKMDELSKKSREYVQSNFSISAVSHQIKKYLEEI